MKGLLVRVAADQSEGGGYWNSPADSQTGKFVYVPIPESSPTHPGLNKPYNSLVSTLGGLGVALPDHLEGQDMHLDPDFEYLTYGDQGSRAKQIQSKVGPGDLLVFYSGMRNTQSPGGLIYAIIGLYVVDDIVSAINVPIAKRHENAHTRRILSDDANDIVVRARPGVSGRLEQFIPIGDYRERAYRVWPELLNRWGGLSVNDGYLQRSARLPEFLDTSRFYDWFLSQKIVINQRNN